MTGDVIDLIVIGFILLVGLVGLIKGFFKSFLSLFGFVGAIIVSIVLREQIAGILESLFGVETLIGGFATEKIGEINSELVNFKTAEAESLISMVNGLDINVILKGIFIKSISGASIVEPVSVADIVASPIAHYVTIGIGVVVATLLIRIAVMILNATIGKIAKGKVFGKFNRLLGFIFGIAKGGIYVVILMCIVTVASLFPTVDSTVKPYMESTTITKFAYEKVNNFVLEKLSGFSIEDLTGSVDGAGQESGSQE